MLVVPDELRLALALRMTGLSLPALELSILGRCQDDSPECTLSSTLVQGFKGWGNLTCMSGRLKLQSGPVLAAAGGCLSGKSALWEVSL